MFVFMSIAYFTSVLIYFAYNILYFLLVHLYFLYICVIAYINKYLYV